MFARNWEEARRTGVPRGAYQFFRPAEDPEEQADLLLEMMGPLQKGDLPPVLDVEVAGDLAPVDVVLRIDRWIARVRRATSVRPVIYASAINWALLTENSARFKRLGLWVAHHEVDCPNTPRPWTHWTFHQRSAAMRLTGISTVVDEDLFLGGSRALRRLRVQDEAAARRAWRHWMKKRQRAQAEAEANADANP